MTNASRVSYTAFFVAWLSQMKECRWPKGPNSFIPIFITGVIFKPLMLG